MKFISPVRVSVPATSANLGPGFDCLGMALALRHCVTMHVVAEPVLEIDVRGEGETHIPRDERNLVYSSAQLLFEKVGRRPAGLRITQENEIPVASGLGSSSSAVLAGLFGANAMLANPLSPYEILQLAADLEGHPDNVAPAVYGGLVLGVMDAGGLIVERIPIPALQCVVLLPEFDFLTTAARAELAQETTLANAIFNAGRLALLIRALQAANYDLLRAAMQDRLHQERRLSRIPGAGAALHAMLAAGAAGVALSGAGPGLLALATGRFEAIARAGALEFAAAGLKSRHWEIAMEPAGVRVEAGP